MHKRSRTTLYSWKTKGQLISKANCQAVNSSKKQTNEFVFTTMQRVFVRFLEEIEDTKKTFRNYLTFMTSSELFQNALFYKALLKGHHQYKGVK